MRSMTSTDPPVVDPMPEPPEHPGSAACCGSGCDPCILDLHERAMEQYRQALREWRARHSETTSLYSRNSASAMPDSPATE